VSSNLPKVRSPKHEERGYRAALLRFLIAISRVARGKGQLCHVLEIYIGIGMRGLDRIAPKTGIDKNFAQLEFYDPTQTKSRLDWPPPASLVVRVLKLAQLLLPATTNALFLGVSEFLKGRTPSEAWFLLRPLSPFSFRRRRSSKLAQTLAELLSTDLVALPAKLSFALLQVAVCCRTSTCTKGRASLPRELSSPPKPKAGLNGPTRRYSFQLFVHARDRLT
jgi:hypothetical protein